MPAMIPDAATYGTQQAYATQAYQKAKSNIQAGQLGWLKQYGMTANYDPNNGSYNNYQVDPTNQYGLIQQNRTSEAQDLNAAQDNAISRGIAGSGLGNQAASSLHFQHGVQDSNLGNTFMQGMGQFGNQLSDAADTYQQSLFGAEQNAIQRALDNQQFEQYYTGSDNTGNNDTDQQSNDKPTTERQLSPGSPAVGSHYGALSGANPTQYDVSSYTLPALKKAVAKALAAPKTKNKAQ